ncbi:MAG: transposase [Gemmatimonadetes bacterium]|nr:transposase [Gemmatimonadota bacterium]
MALVRPVREYGPRRHDGQREGLRETRDARRAGCRGIRNLRIRPYRPQASGKAERFVQTMLRPRGYKRRHRTSREHNNALPDVQDCTNLERPHGWPGGIRPLLPFLTQREQPNLNRNLCRTASLRRPRRLPHLESGYVGA